MHDRQPLALKPPSQCQAHVDRPLFNQPYCPDCYALLMQKPQLWHPNDLPALVLLWAYVPYS
jgi:hypothetical protein